MPRYFSAISSAPLKRFVGRIAPELPAHAAVQALGKGFGQPVGQRLHQNGGIVVIGALEALGDHVFADAGGDGEGADVILHAAGARRDEIAERDIVAALALGELLAQRMQRRDRLCCARLLAVHQNIVALGAFAGQKPKAALAVNQRSATILSSMARASSNSERATRPNLASSRMAGNLPFNSQVWKNGVQSMKSISSATG